MKNLKNYYNSRIASHHRERESGNGSSADNYVPAENGGKYETRSGVASDVKTAAMIVRVRWRVSLGVTATAVSAMTTSTVTPYSSSQNDPDSSRSSG